jgi:hypothetical protein
MSRRKGVSALAAALSAAPAAQESAAQHLAAQESAARSASENTRLRAEVCALRKEFAKSRAETVLERTKRAREAEEHAARLEALRAELSSRPASSIKQAHREIKMNSDMYQASEPELRAALKRAKDIETALRHRLCAQERTFDKKLDAERDKIRVELGAQLGAQLRASQEAELRARDWLRLLGAEACYPLASGGAAAAGSPRSPAAGASADHASFDDFLGVTLC